MAPSQFGDDAMGDRHLVRELREGRELRRATREKVRGFMAMYRALQHEEAGTPGAEPRSPRKSDDGTPQAVVS